jgi:deoxyribonuclease-2
MLNRLLQCFNLCNSKNRIYFSIALKKPDGKMYSYYDSENISDSFIIKENINEWINNLYIKNNNKWTYQLLYNDEIPDNMDNHKTFFLNKKGHNKGILLWNSTTIGWLIHSVPKYPNEIELKNFKIEDIEEGQLIYGQSFVYIELDIKELDNIFRQLKIMEASVYFTNYNKYGDIKLVDINLGTNLINNIKLDENIFHISKSSKWNKDIYDEYLRIFMDSKILCQSWMKPGLNSTENTKNIKNIKWDDKINYTTSQDHSKYAISMNKNNPWVHIGDINRMESQYRRGGGGIIIKDKNLWNCFNKIIVDYNDLVLNPNNL